MIGSYYKPKEYDTDSLQELQLSLEKASKTKANIWLGGDFNLPKMNWQTVNPASNCNFISYYNNFINTFYDHNLTQTVLEPTRENNILDLFLTTNPTVVRRSSVIPGISDHNIALIDTNVAAQVRRQRPRQIPLYKRADWDGLKQHMTRFHVDMTKSGAYNTITTNQLWEQFTNTLEKGCQHFIPIRKASSRNGLPWVNRTIKRLLRKRNKLYRKMKTQNTQQLRKRFLEMKHLCRRQVKLAYESYLEDLLTPHDTSTAQTKPDTKKLYTLLKHAKQDAHGIDTLKTNGKSFQKDTDKANVLNEQFQSVFTAKSPLPLSSLCTMRLQEVEHSIPEGTRGSRCHGEMDDIQISTQGIEKLLLNLKPHKAAGPDNIRPIVLKELHKEIAPILQKLFTVSLSSGRLPDIWKHANVAPVYKKGPRADPANYRPISLTSILCKTLEHIVASSIVKHFTKHDLFYELQHGFREKRSCQTQLVMLVEDLMRAANQKQQTDLILLDFSKAFDKVNHEKLILKLHNHGIRGNTLKWIKNFLDNRTQSVVVNGSVSDSIPVSSGVPQGSVLGPLLFLVYINDLPVGLKSRARLFADDTAVYLSIKSAAEASQLQDDLRLLEKWEAQWDMHFNPSKCQVIHITKKKIPLDTQYILHGTVLEAVSSAKYLGVTLSDDLSWNTHIDNITKKASQTLGFIRRNLKVRSEKVKLAAYKTLVRPQLEYCSPVWSPHQVTKITQLEMVQRRAARWVKQDYARTSSVTNMLSSLQLRTLELRRIDQSLILMHNIVRQNVAIPVQQYLTRNPRPSRSLHPEQFRRIQSSLDCYKFSFFPRVVVAWNALGPGIVDLPPEQFSQAVCKEMHFYHHGQASASA